MALAEACEKLWGKVILMQAIINYATGDGDTKAVVITDCSIEEGTRTCCPLFGNDASEADARGIINIDAGDSRADTLAIGMTPAIPNAAVAYLVEAQQHLDVQMDQLARMFAHEAPHRVG